MGVSMTEYQEVYYQSTDGLSLYARDYGGEKDNTILAMHGLTRNSADFEESVSYLTNYGRVIAVDQRGRGRSDYDPNWRNYNPTRYVEDMWVLLDYLNIEKAILLGTSMGGIMSMIMGAQQPDRVKAIILNDIGPVVEQTGLSRIKNYVGKMPPVRSWDEATSQAAELNADFYPSYRKADWLAFAKRTYIERDGVPVLAYDQGLSKPIEAEDSATVPPELWSLYEACIDIPTLIVRGELSDIISEKTLDEMVKRHKKSRAVTVPNTGHAPFLIEPEAQAALEGFLMSLDN